MTRYFSQSVRKADDEKEIVDSAMKLAQASEEQSTPSQSGEPSNGIYISNMAWDAGENHLREAFSKFGTIDDIKIIRDQTGRSRGYVCPWLRMRICRFVLLTYRVPISFGFVTFDSAEAATAATEECNQSFWHGRRIRVEPRKSNETAARTSNRSMEKSDPTRALYIGNIPYETSDADLNKLFRDLDNVVDVRVAVDRNTGWPRGFAHADFADVESATKAHEAISKMELGGRTLRVDFSQPRDQSRGQNRGQDRGGRY